mmetsp:Transcript_28910/g.81419  ORF Transcript_28910/g.81419 Transcript_28910/m.81419 type:complete len:231 (-) Transcript_28910:1453-2145(-)
MSAESTSASEFYCPITYEVMVDPVVASDGFTYERSAIVDWLRRHDTSPMTRQKISRYLHPNNALRQMISDHHGVQFTCPAAATAATMVTFDGTDSPVQLQSRAVLITRRVRAGIDLVARLQWRAKLVCWLVLRPIARRVPAKKLFLLRRPGAATRADRQPSPQRLLDPMCLLGQAAQLTGRVAGILSRGAAVLLYPDLLDSANWRTLLAPQQLGQLAACAAQCAVEFFSL